MVSKAKPLNDELKKRFYPFVKSKGFEKKKSSDPHFAEFIRVTSSGEETFEIQWDKYWRPYFVVNFKKKGNANPAWVHSGRLQRKRGGFMSCWFSLSRPLIDRVLKFRWGYEPNEVVDELISAFSELEQWWEAGIAGAHIHIIARHA